MKQKSLSDPFPGLAFVVILAALLFLRRPIDVKGWNGILPIETTSPTMTLLPDDGWWNDLPTSRVQRPIPASNSRPTFSPTP